MNKTIATTRGEARALGETLYYTGLECINGHTTVRSAANGACRECRRQYQRSYSSKHRSSVKYKAYQRQYQAKYRLTAKGKSSLKAANVRYREKIKAPESNS